MTNDPLTRLAARRNATMIASDAGILLSGIESSIGTSLPAAYSTLLLLYQGPVLFDKDISFHSTQRTPWDRKDGTQPLELLYGLTGDRQSLVKNLKSYEGRMPSEVIPIGEAPGGNLICLGVRDAVKGKVYFWDHENERQITGITENDFGNMYLIAKSFDDFLQSLQPDEVETTKSPDGIVGVWLSDDL